MTFMKNTIKVITAALAITVIVAGAVSAGNIGQKPAASRAEEIGSYFNRTTAEIESLRVHGYGYGEIVKIFVIAEMSRKEFPLLLEENSKGYGWGTISGRLGLKPSYVKARVDAARKFLKIGVHTEAKSAAVK